MINKNKQHEQASRMEKQVKDLKYNGHIWIPELKWEDGEDKREDGEDKRDDARVPDRCLTYEEIVLEFATTKH